MASRSSPPAWSTRIFAGMTAEETMMEAVVRARQAGYQTALLSNSWGLRSLPARPVPRHVRRRRHLG